MKRIIALITLLSMLTLALVGCGKLDVEDSVKALKAKGMREGATYESDEDLELAVYSTEPRCLIFHTALLTPKTTRTTIGVQVMTLKKQHTVKVSVC